MKKGFTLIEMMVVIVILAALVGLGALGVGKALRTAEGTQRESFAPVVESAIAAYRAEVGEYPFPDGTTIGINDTTLEFGIAKGGSAESPANGPVMMKLLGRNASGQRQDGKRAYITDSSDLYVYTNGRVQKLDEKLASGGLSASCQIGFRVRMNETKASAFKKYSDRFAFAPVRIVFDVDLDRVNVTVPGPSNYNQILEIR